MHISHAQLSIVISMSFCLELTLSEGGLWSWAELKVWSGEAELRLRELRKLRELTAGSCGLPMLDTDAPSGESWYSWEDISAWPGCAVMADNSLSVCGGCSPTPSQRETRPSPSKFKQSSSS